MYSVQSTMTSPKNFGEFAGVVETWRGKRPEGAFPRWCDYDIPDFRKWIGYVSLARVIENPFDLIYEYYGTALCHFASQDMTGRLLSEFFGPDNHDQHRRTVGYLETLWHEKGIGVQRVTFDTPNRERIDASVIDLIVGKRTPDPTHILSYLYVHHRSKPYAPSPLVWQAPNPEGWRIAGD